MTRRTWLATVFGVTATAHTVSARTGVHVTGKLDATEQEAQEGYFNVGRELMIATHPKSPVIEELRALVGATVQVSVFQP